MEKNKLIIGGVIVVVIVVAGIFMTFENATIETLNRINIEFGKADIEMSASWNAINKGDYEIAKIKTYNAHSYIKRAFQYYLDVKTRLTEPERVAWRTSFELRRADFDLTISTIHWYVEIDEFGKIPKERFLTEFELFIRRTEELSNAWERYITKLEFVQRTQPDLGITDAKISIEREWHAMIETSAKESRITLSELRDLMPEYISIDDRVISPIIVIPPVSEEIIPSDLARFFDGFDVDRNREIDLGEAQDFFYWAEKNVVYRWDDEKAYLEPDFFPGFPVGDRRPGPEYWQTPHTTWIERAGDCEDTAILQLAFYNHFGIRAYLAGVNAKGGEIDHAITIVAIGGTPEEFANLLGNLVYYEIDGIYFMLVDNAYSDAFGYLSGGLKKGTFDIFERYTLEGALEEAARRR